MKLAVLDTLGCMCLGSSNTSAAAIIPLVKELGGAEEATVLGAGFRTSAPYAALVNGTMGHRYDYDDGISPAMGLHAGISILPAAIAIAEREDSDGRAFIKAAIGGYEVASRITRGLSGARHRFSHSTCFGAFGAAVASAILCELDEKQLLNALGIVGALIPATPFAPFADGAMVKDMYGGWPAYTGLFSALLAKNGFTGQEDILEAQGGTYENITGAKGNLHAVLESLGEEFLWVKGHYFKPHSACRATHVIADAALKFASEHQINPREVEEVFVTAPHEATILTGGPTPKNDIQARASFNYIAATILVKGKLTLDSFSPENLSDPQITSVAEKTKLLVDTAASGVHHEKGHGPARILVRLKDGSMKASIAHVDRSLEGDDVVRKFQDTAGKVFNTGTVRRVAEIVQDFEKHEVKDVTSLLARPIKDNS